MTDFDNVINKDIKDSTGFDPWQVPLDPVPDTQFKFSAKPKDTVSIDFIRATRTFWNDEGSEKVTDSKKPEELHKAIVKINHGDCTSTSEFRADRISVQGVGKLMDGDMKSSLDGKLEYNFLKDVWKGTGLLNFASGDLGGAKANVNLKFERGNDNKQKVSVKTNIEAQKEYNVGAGVEHDGADITRLLWQAVYNPASSGKFWLRGDTKDKYVAGGCSNSLNDSINHTWEAQYAYGEKHPGINGTKVTLRGGVSYDLSDASGMEVGASWGEGVELEHQFVHKVDKNWTFAGW